MKFFFRNMTQTGQFSLIDCIYFPSYSVKCFYNITSFVYKVIGSYLKSGIQGGPKNPQKSLKNNFETLKF